MNIALRPQPEAFPLVREMLRRAQQKRAHRQGRIARIRGQGLTDDTGQEHHKRRNGHGQRLADHQQPDISTALH